MLLRARDHLRLHVSGRDDAVGRGSCSSSTTTAAYPPGHDRPRGFAFIGQTRGGHNRWVGYFPGVLAPEPPGRRRGAGARAAGPRGRAPAAHGRGPGVRDGRARVGRRRAARRAGGLAGAGGGGRRPRVAGAPSRDRRARLEAADAAPEVATPCCAAALRRRRRPAPARPRRPPHPARAVPARGVPRRHLRLPPPRARPGGARRGGRLGVGGARERPGPAGVGRPTVVVCADPGLARATGRPAGRASWPPSGRRPRGPRWPTCSGSRRSGGRWPTTRRCAPTPGRSSRASRGSRARGGSPRRGSRATGGGAQLPAEVDLGAVLRRTDDTAAVARTLFASGRRGRRAGAARRPRRGDRSAATESFADVLAQIHASVLVSAPEAGAVATLRRAGGALNTHLAALPGPTGVAARAGRLAIGTPTGVARYRDVPSARTPPRGNIRRDACFVPSHFQVTGDVGAASWPTPATSCGSWPPGSPAWRRWTTATPSCPAGGRPS